MDIINSLLYLYSEINDENLEIELQYNINKESDEEKEKLRIF